MNTLLIIDPQNDFCNPGDKQCNAKGSLYVPGAEEDMKRLAYWILANQEEIDHIIVTLDSHFINDISHPNFWINKDGQHPEPFTQITHDDLMQEKWLPLFLPERTKEYLKRLEEQKQFTHTIWPEHCLVGSEGAAIFKPLLDAINTWQKQGKFYQPIIKGQYPFAEHFGAFAAQVQFNDIPETQLNTELLETLDKFTNIFIAGEAKSHCVANTIKQMIEFKPALVKKLKILEDTMSNVPGFEHIADEIYEKARSLGAEFITTAYTLAD